MAISHTQAARALYGASEKAAPATTATPSTSREAAAKVLYRGGALSDQPFLGYRGRISSAKQRDDLREAARLEAEEREVRQFSEQLKFSDAQALRVVNVIRDTTHTPLTRKEMLPGDKLILDQRFGPAQADAIKATAKQQIQKLLADKPTLAQSLKVGHGAIHIDAVEAVAEAVQALGLVKPIT